MDNCEDCSKEYLGDGVYVALDGHGMLKLTTEDGISATNTVVLELPVYEALVRYVERLKRSAQPESEG